MKLFLYVVISLLCANNLYGGKLTDDKSLRVVYSQILGLLNNDKDIECYVTGNTKQGCRIVNLNLFELMELCSLIELCKSSTDTFDLIKIKKRPICNSFVVIVDYEHFIPKYKKPISPEETLAYMRGLYFRYGYGDKIVLKNRYTYNNNLIFYLEQFGCKVNVKGHKSESEKRYSCREVKLNKGSKIQFKSSEFFNKYVKQYKEEKIKIYQSKKDSFMSIHGLTK